MVDIAEFLPAAPVIRCVSPASVAQYCSRTSRSSLQCALDGDTVQSRQFMLVTVCSGFYSNNRKSSRHAFRDLV